MSSKFMKFLKRKAARDFGLKGQIQSDYHEANSCRRKIRYGHKETAIKAAISMQEKTGDTLDVYECVFCKGWHIGHPSGIRVTVEVASQDERLRVAAGEKQDAG